MRIVQEVKRRCLIEMPVPLRCCIFYLPFLLSRLSPIPSLLPASLHAYQSAWQIISMLITESQSNITSLDFSVSSAAGTSREEPSPLSHAQTVVSSSMRKKLFKLEEEDNQVRKVSQLSVSRSIAALYFLNPASPSLLPSFLSSFILAS